MNEDTKALQTAVAEGKEVGVQQAHEMKVVQSGPHPMEILQEMTRKGVPIEQIREIRSLVEWYEDREAEKAFNRAMTGFRKESIPIIKNRHVKYTTNRGVTEYDHPTLDHIVELASPVLGNHGFSYNWQRIKHMQDTKLIEIECIITHEQGHSIRTSLDSYPDESGGKNHIQAVISTVSYLERVTFLMLTGLAAKGVDTDGRPSAAGPDPDAISGAQATVLKKLIDDTGTRLDSFLGYATIEKIEDLPARRFAECKDMLERRKANLQQKSKGSK